MTGTLLTIALLAAAMRIGIAWVTRRRRRLGPVSREWLHAQSYRREGDQP